MALHQKAMGPNEGLPITPTSGLAVEEILVYLEHGELAVLLNCNAVVHHEGGQLHSINEDDPAVTVRRGSCHCSCHEAGCRDEYPQRGPMRVEGSDEVPDLRATDDGRVRVSLCLDVDIRQPEGILADDAVDTAIAGLPHMLFLTMTTAVPHGPQQLDDGLFEELRCGLLQSTPQLGLDL